MKTLNFSIKKITTQTRNIELAVSDETFINIANFFNVAPGDLTSRQLSYYMRNFSEDRMGEELYDNSKVSINAVVSHRDNGSDMMFDDLPRHQPLPAYLN